jgi:PhzF family phenazine biosynthesis protein
MTSTLPAVLVEAFASGPMQGNGAAVVRLQQPAAAAWMQALAASFKQSETAFLLPLAGGGWALRWFTPSCEVPLCGHATLAATLALAHWGELQPGQSLALHSRSGPLAVSLLEAGPPAAASLVLPSGPLTPLPAPAALEQLLGCRLEGYWSSELGYRVALLPEALPLAAVEPLAAGLQGADRQGLVLMQPWSGPEAPQVLGHPPDYQLRFFAPGLGIEEDPVTGSAHALVAPWWMQRLGKAEVVGWQPSNRRGGMICASPQPGFVRLTGTGHLLWDGHLNAGGMALEPQAWSACAAS